jgi:hypothetical protein
VASNRRGRGINAKGRSKKRGKFVALGNDLLTSDAWLSLTGSGVKYYVELRRRFNGTNNGELHLSCAAAARLLKMSMGTAANAQRELEEKGFIRMTRRGGFHQRQATTWALTDEAAPGQTATHDYRNWPPKENPSLPRLNDVVTETEREPP